MRVAIVFWTILLCSRLASAAETTATANVVADCHLDVPSVIKMDLLSTRDLAALQPGGRLSAFASTFSLTSTCYGTRDYRLSLIPGASLDSCMDSGKSGMVLCLQANGRDLALGPSGAEITDNSANKTTTLKVIPQRTKGIPESGEYSTLLYLVLEPL